MKKYRLYGEERKARLITEDIKELEENMAKTRCNIVKEFEGKKLIRTYLVFWMNNCWKYVTEIDFSTEDGRKVAEKLYSDYCIHTTSISKKKQLQKDRETLEKKAKRNGYRFTPDYHKLEKINANK